MTLKLRENIYIGDKDSLGEIEQGAITSILNVADDLDYSQKDVEKYKYIKIGLSLTKANPSFIKDLASHCGKYQVQYGEVLLVVGMTGLRRAAFIACRIVCELEDKGIYEVLQEVKKMKPEFKMGEAYL
jgi:hypothetical protein